MVGLEGYAFLVVKGENNENTLEKCGGGENGKGEEAVERNSRQFFIIIQAIRWQKEGGAKRGFPVNTGGRGKRLGGGHHL